MTRPVEIGDFRERECPPADVVLVDPPYGIGKKYAGEQETISYQEWVHALHQYAKPAAKWLLILGPWFTMTEWLHLIPKPDRILVWHRTFVHSFNRKRKKSSWVSSATPCLVYNFGGQWLGLPHESYRFHDVIDAFSSVGDVQKQIKIGIRVKIGNTHPGVTGTFFPTKVLKPILPDGGHVHDPMAGVGSILVAALRMGSRVSGWEINPEWADIANEWLEWEQNDLGIDPVINEILGDPK